jgi:intein/homing endonuclease
MIAIPDNFEKPIEEIKVGDIVLSFNENKKMVEEKIVTEINSPIHDDLVEYKFSNNSTIVCTFDHPLYVNGLNLSSYKPNLTNSRYNLSQNVTQINVGDVVNLLDNNTTTILEINELETIKTQTYIFSVDGNRNFFANGILVHNKQ